MSVFEMPLEQLRAYKGTNPCPDDIDDYWATALAEMAAVNPQLELIPADFTCNFARCYDMYFTGVRNARIHVKYIVPNKLTSPAPAVIQFHGYGGNAGDWTSKLYWAAQGFVVAAPDCRGQGGLSTDTGILTGTTFRGHIVRGLDDDPQNMLMRHIFLDTAQLARIIIERPEVDSRRVHAFGYSQGGGLTLACASLEERICRLAPVYPFLSDYKRVWQMDLAIDAYEEITRYFRMFDPRHEREEQIFTRLGYIDIQHLAKRIKGQVFFTTALMDQICPPSSQFATYNKISAPKQITFYPDFGHELLPDLNDKIFSFFNQ